MAGFLLLDDAREQATRRLEDFARQLFPVGGQPQQASGVLDEDDIVQRLTRTGLQLIEQASPIAPPQLQALTRAPEAVRSVQQGAQVAQQAVQQLQPLIPQPAPQAQPAPEPQAPAQPGGDLQQYARQAAQRAGIDPDIFERQIQQESGFNPKAKSPAGATGIAQIMPATARGWGVDPNDPYASLDAAARNMATYIDKYGGWENALRAYNAGPGAIERSREFKETNTYVQRILSGAKQQVEQAVKPFVRGAQAVGNALHEPSTPQQTPGTQIANTPNAEGQVFPLAARPSNRPDATYHSAGGSDLMAARGTPVLNMRSGTVSSVYTDNGSHQAGGNAVMIRGDDGLDYYYAHFDQPPSLKTGQRVEAGAQIGAVGNSGNAWKGGKGDPHLHIGIGRGISNGVGSEGGLGRDFNAQKLLADLLPGVGQATTTTTEPVQTAASVAPPKTLTRPLEDLGQGVQELGRQGLNLVEQAGQSLIQPQTQGLIQRALPGGEPMTPARASEVRQQLEQGAQGFVSPLTQTNRPTPIDVREPQRDYVSEAVKRQLRGEEDVQVGPITVPSRVAGAAGLASEFLNEISPGTHIGRLGAGYVGEALTDPVRRQAINAQFEAQMRGDRAEALRQQAIIDARSEAARQGITDWSPGAAYQRGLVSPARETAEMLGNIVTGVTGAGLAPAGLAGGGRAALAGLAVDPTGVLPFEALGAAARGIGGLGRRPALRQFLTDEAGELRIPGGFNAPGPERAAPPQRMYHGTADEFGAPEPGRFDSQGLYGPGYYLTSDPRVAGGVVARGGELQELEPGTVIRPGYAQERAVQEGLAPDVLADLQRRADTARATLAQNPEPNLRTFVEDELARVEARLATNLRGMGANVRPVDVPRGLNLFDADAPAADLVATVSDRLARVTDEFDPMWGGRLADRFEESLQAAPGRETGQDVYNALTRALDGRKDQANDLLADLGYDGIRHTGGQRMPITDALGSGEDITHDVNVIFPQSLPKIRNAISGRQGGFASARFASQLGGTVAGGAAGYATTPEEAGPGERLLRTGAGAVAGLTGTSAAMGLPGAMRIGREVTDVRDAARAVAATQSNLPGMAAQPPGKAERVLAYLVNNALSGTASFITNASGLLENARRPIVSAATAGVELATGNVRGAQREMAAAGADVVAQAAALSDGLAAMGETFVTGIRPSRIISGDVQREAFEGPAGMVATPFLRGLGAVDEMNATLSNAGGQGAEIGRLMAQHPNLSLQDIMARYQSRIMAEGAKATEEALYISGGSGIGRWWSGRTQEFIRDPSRWKQAAGIGMNILVPFAKIPDVLLTRGLMRLPVINEVRAGIQATRAVRAGRPTEAKRIIAEAKLTSMINTAVAYQVLEGNITGNGPSDPMRKRAKMAARDENGNAVWAPNSIRVGDRWISYSSWGPLAVQIGGIANGIEAVRDESRELTPEYVSAAFLATGETIADAWYLQSMARIFSGIRNGQWAETAGETITDYVSRIVPEGALANQIRNATDPNIREPQNYFQRLQNRLPGVAGGAGPIPPVPERIDLATGRAFQRPSDWTSFLVRGTVRGEPDRVNVVLAEHNLPSPQLPDTLSMGPQRFQLNQAEKEAYARALGPELTKRVVKFADSPSFQKQDPLEQQEQLRRQVGFAREIAEQKVWATIPQSERRRRAAEYQAYLQRQGLPQTFEEGTAEELGENFRTNLASGLSAAEQRARQLVGVGGP